MEFVDDTGDSYQDLAVSFPIYGVWVYNIQTKKWNQIHNETCQLLAGGDLDGDGIKSTLAMYYSKYGLWYRKNGNYTCIYSGTIADMAWIDINGDSRQELFFSVPAGADCGIYLYQEYPTPQLTQIHSMVPKIMAAYRNGGNLVGLAAFESYGIWAYNGSGWENIHPYVPVALTQADIDGDGSYEIIACFNTPSDVGVYIRRGTTWSQLTSQIAKFLGYANLDGDGVQEVIMALPDMGLYSYSDSNGWFQLNTDCICTCKTIATCK